MSSYSKYLYKLNFSASSSHTIIQDTTPLAVSVIKQILDLDICTTVTAKNLTASLRYKEGNIQSCLHSTSANIIIKL